MMTEQAELMREIDRLPPMYVREALDFVGYLRQKAESRQSVGNRKPLSQYFGILSPDTYGDGVAYQRNLRSEWND